MTNQLIRNLSVALLAAASICAQGSQKLTVQVPFGFHVGSSTLPSGEYTVDTDAAPGVVRLRSTDSKSAVMIQSMSVQAPAASSQGKLIFNKYGDEYFLSQIWKPGVNTGCELHKTRREIEVAAIARRGLESVMAKK
jgi:hypothetical protein